DNFYFQGVYPGGHCPSKIGLERWFPENAQIVAIDFQFCNHIDVTQVKIEPVIGGDELRRQLEGFEISGGAGEIFHAGVRVLRPGDELVQKYVVRRAGVGWEAQPPRSRDCYWFG